jgi:hypothetical protein
MKIKIVTKEHEYQGLYHDTVIENAQYITDDTMGFKHNGKNWTIARDDVVFVHDGVVSTKQPDAEHTGGSVSALDKQVSGDHYKDCKIQPIEYIHANGLSYLEGNVIKYTTRHSKKNGKADIEKAIHYLELILEMEYKES